MKNGDRHSFLKSLTWPVKECAKVIATITPGSACFQDLVMTSQAKFDTGCLVFSKGDAVNTDDGLQVLILRYFPLANIESAGRKETCAATRCFVKLPKAAY